MNIKVNSSLFISNNVYLYKPLTSWHNTLNYLEKYISILINNIANNNQIENISQIQFNHSVNIVYINVKIYSPYNQINQIDNIKKILHVFLPNNLLVSRTLSVNKLDPFSLNFFTTKTPDSKYNLYEHYFSNIFSKEVRLNFYFYTKPYNNTFIFGKKINYLNNLFVSVLPYNRFNQVKSMMKFYFKAMNLQIKDNTVQKSIKDVIEYTHTKQNLKKLNKNYTKLNSFINSMYLHKTLIIPDNKLKIIERLLERKINSTN